MEVLRRLIAPGHLTLTGWTIAGVVIAIILLPSLYYELSSDIGLFFVGGEKLLHGGTYYRDIVDVKPPLIYYLNMAAIALFDPAQSSIRILDILLQGATCLLIVRLVRRASGDDIAAAAAAICYALLYVTQGPWATTQTESYVALFTVAILSLLLHHRSSAGMFAVGVLAGVAGLFKFSFTALLGVAIIVEAVIADGSWKQRSTNILLMIAGITAAALAFLAFLLGTGTIGEFALMNRFTSAYTRIGWGHPGELLKGILQTIPFHIGDHYTLVLLLGTAAGVARSFGRSDRENAGTTRLLQACTVAMLILLATVVIEAKLVLYQFLRIYGVGAIVAALGLLGLLRSIPDATTGGPYRRIMLGAIIVLGLLFSPLPRYLMAGREAIAMLFHQPSRAREFTNPALAEIDSVGSYLEHNRGDGEDIFAAANNCGPIYYSANYTPRRTLYFFAALIAPFSPKQWKDSIGSYLTGERPRFIVTQLDDAIPGVTGSDQSSAQALRALPGLDALLGTSYAIAFRTEHYEVYRRR